jgi:hypothetical protein
VGRHGRGGVWTGVWCVRSYSTLLSRHRQGVQATYNFTLFQIKSARVPPLAPSQGPQTIKPRKVTECMALAGPGPTKLRTHSQRTKPAKSSSAPPPPDPSPAHLLPHPRPLHEPNPPPSPLPHWCHDSLPLHPLDSSSRRRPRPSHSCCLSPRKLPPTGQRPPVSLSPPPPPSLCRCCLKIPKTPAFPRPVCVCMCMCVCVCARARAGEREREKD